MNNLYGVPRKPIQAGSLDLEGMLKGMLRPDEDTYSIDAQTHTVHFSTTPSLANRITDTLSKCDKPVKQALIRAKILAVSSSTIKDLGITFEALFEVGNAELTAAMSLPSQVGERSGSLAIRQLTGTQYNAIIKAIQTDNRSHILANPQITAMDQQKAEVRMATDEPFTETSIDSASGRAIENVRFLQVGTVLQVTPTIKEDGTVEMVIALDVSSLTEIRNGVPVVNRNMASSTVAVLNNHVLMIGGLKFNREMKVREKVPLLGDIPLLGKAFQSNRKEVVESELILFLQPSIVEDSQAQTQEARIDKTAESGEHSESLESGSLADEAESGGLKADR